MVHRRRPWLLILVAVLSLSALACGDNGDGDGDGDGAEDAAAEATPESDTTTTEADGAAEAPEPIDLGRVVVLGEDFLLADVLALGVEPVAATATLGDRFVGIDRDTSGIEPLDQFQLNAEQLAALRPDLLVTTTFYADQAGLDRLEAVAETVVVPDDEWRSQFTALGEALGAEQRAEDLLAAHDDAVAEADRAIDDDLVASLATVYSGENIAVWTDGPVNIPSTFIEAGVTLRPGPGELADESNGRAYISLELLELLDGEVIVLLQTSTVEGEDAALGAVQDSGLWERLPAVVDDRVVTVDRLGYAGIEGRIRLAGELPELLG